jgi:two-component system response regulator LytT
MNILILEDERRNYNHLRRMIEAMDRTFSTIGPAASIQEAVEYMRHGEVADIILADIRLSDGLSFEAFNREPPSVPVIFTTAYDEYAIKAFKYNAIDYLLKPVDADELEAAIRRARQMVARPVEGDLGQLFRQLGQGGIGTRRGFCCRGATATDRCWCATSTMCSPRIRCRDCA